MNTFLIQLIDGVAIGSIYGLIAMAIVLVFRATKVINVAQGEFAVLSTYFVWQMLQWGVNLYLAILIMLPVSFLLGMLVQRTIIRRTEGKEHLVSITVTIGMLLIINQAIGWVWSTDVRSFPSVFGDGNFVLAGVRVSAHTIGTIAVLLSTAALIHIFMVKTKLGLAMRSAAEHAQWSRLAGIPASSMFMVGWGFSLAVGALAGLLAAPTLFLEPNMLLGASLYAFAAAAIGGFDSLPGAVVGGITVGVIENLAGSYIEFIGSDLKIVVPLLLMFVVLLTRPSGLFGTREVNRV
ncbi:branched-chain amino acid ABC transporter permease [Alcanivorax marinus]|uniref:Branched-chain amino acid ABC transporter permease n=1 Tax=Alloalcanivorax marinus TaxID=1177169 RepID=A0A9Q3YP36_9GAMM|nr:branched-chain amino acid ABC transporter permease [Alloalcanivorax marinus]MCC4310427.1 branched-chain amino acid ABC transporter permease [Alloalcanivorax marinus]MCU5785574.1 inner-membrane translocator [Alloalcanivorax marinus]